MKRFLLLVTTVWIIAVVGMPLASTAAAAEAQQRSAAAKGGNKPPKPPATEMTFRLALADRQADSLLSDGRIRQDPLDNIDDVEPFYDDSGWRDSDVDEDGFGDLTGPFAGMGLIFYQDSRITAAQSGIHPDPCSTFNTDDDSGIVRARLNAFNCSVENPVYQDDDRTFTLVFDRNDGDPDDAAEGGSCACDKFSYLTGPMLGRAAANSTFVDNGDTCEVTPAAGPIVTDSDINKTGSQQILAWPYEIAKKGKGKGGGESKLGLTTVHINFRTDRQDPAQPNGWQLQSQGENIPIEPPIDELTRVVTANNHPFDLWLGGEGNTPQCANVHMSFQMTFTRFEVTQ